MNERRLARLKEQIKQRLAVVLQRELADPKLGLVTITRIELDTEFTHCKAYWSVLAGSDQEGRARRDNEGALKRARGFCQREMAKVLHTRSIPHLEFLFDEGIGAAIRMNKLLSELNPDRDVDASTASDAGQPDVVQSDAGQPDAAQPDEAQPNAVQPDEVADTRPTDTGDDAKADPKST